MFERSLPMHVLSPAMQMSYDAGLRAAASAACILIQGEPGVGKTLMAHRLHQLTPRAEAPMVAVNCCTAFSGGPFSPLYGHEKGAFDGAIEASRGLLEEASGGTVLLDHVESLPLWCQGQLARAMDTQSIFRVGAAEPRPIDVRFIAVADYDLEAVVTVGKFRRVLLSALSKVTLTIPPLRERRSEIPELARFFVAQHCSAEGRSAPLFSPAAMAILMECKWNDNILTLRLFAQRAAILCEGGEIGPEHLPKSLT